jgi:hypothetical protein
MRYLLAGLLVVLSMAFAYGQDRFRVDYNYFAIYHSKTKTWSEWEQGSNTFVFNINSNGDVALYQANGEVVYYRKVSGVEEKKTDTGKEYQIIYVLDKDGLRCGLQLFTDPTLGLKIMYDDIMIQFVKEK